MYAIIKSVIQTKSYKDSNTLLAKIQRLYVEGALTEEQYTELRSLLIAAEPSKDYDAAAEIDKLWVEIRDIRRIIADIPVPEPDPTPAEIPDWVQPTGAHDAYQTGDKVRYKGAIYESLIDGNVWAPDVYPAGWREVAD